MTVTVDERLLLEIIEGCEGVTPGPWHFVEENSGLMPDHGYGLLHGQPGAGGWEENLYLSVGCSTRANDALGNGVPEKNAAHIARLDPQTVHALATELLAARKEIAGLREGLAPFAWQPGETVPPAKNGAARVVIVAVSRAQQRGKVYTFPAQYLNAYPLNYEDCICASDDDHPDDGCPTTGWFTERSDEEYDSSYQSLLSGDDVLVAWREIEPHPLDARNLLAGGNSNE